MKPRRHPGLAIGPLHITWFDLWEDRWCFEIVWHR